MQQNNVEINNLIEELKEYGDLTFIANKGQGKTNSLKVLASELIKDKHNRVIIFETFPKFCKSFEHIAYMKILDSDVKETKHVINLENTFVSHERDYTVLKGYEIETALKENRNIIFTLEVKDIERIAFFVYSVVNQFYRRNYLRQYKDYEKQEHVIFIIEESQNVFDSSTISKKIFNRLRKIFSEARNLNIHFVMCSQRLQDINTKIRARTRLILGNVSLDDYELKIRRLLRHSQYRKEVLNFKKGQFLNVSSDKIIQFPEYKTTSKAFEITPTKPVQPIQKKKGILARIFNLQINPNSIYCKPVNQHAQTKEDFNEFEDSELEEEDYILFDEEL